MQLRKYQSWAVDKILEKTREYDRVCSQVATAGGKSIICAELCRRLNGWGKRTLVLVPNREIALQNEEKMKLLAPEIDVGIFLAGLGRKEHDATVVIAGRDSAEPNIDKLGKFEVVIVDECHLVSIDPDSRFQKIFEATEPKKIIGFTGTPYRIDTGYIYGIKKPFQVNACAIGIDLLTEKGFLCPHRFVQEDSIIDRKSLKKRGGEFVESEITEKMLQGDLTRKTVAKFTRMVRIAEKKNCIVFCASIKHAAHVVITIQELEPDLRVEILHGQLPAKERDKIMLDARNGEIHYLVNVDVLTTGTDIPCLDVCIHLRPTESAALWVQSVGRVLRLHPGKTEALIFDFAGNIEHFESLSNPKIPPPKPNKKQEITGRDLEEMGIDPEEVSGSVNTKICPNCHSVCVAQWRHCKYCNHLFLKHSSKLSTPLKTDEKLFELSQYYIKPRQLSSGYLGFEVIYITKDYKRFIEVLSVDHPSERYVARSRKRLSEINEYEKYTHIIVKQKEGAKWPDKITLKRLSKNSSSVG